MPTLADLALDRQRLNAQPGQWDTLKSAPLVGSGALNSLSSASAVQPTPPEQSPPVMPESERGPAPVPAGTPEQEGISPAANAQRQAAERADQQAPTPPEQPPPDIGYSTDASKALMQAQVAKGQREVSNMGRMAGTLSGNTFVSSLLGNKSQGGSSGGSLAQLLMSRRSG